MDLDTSSGTRVFAAETTGCNDSGTFLFSQRAPTIVSADASYHGVGTVLLQIEEEGRRAPIMYSSRSLTATEQKYSQIEKETLAMAWACKSSIVICLELKCRSWSKLTTRPCLQ